MTLSREAYIELGELSPEDIEERHERTRGQLFDAYQEIDTLIEAAEKMFDTLKVSHEVRLDFLGGLLANASDMIFWMTEGDSKEMDHADYEGAAFKRARQMNREWEEERRVVATLKAGVASC